VYSPWIVTASLSWWESLSPEERSAIEASAQAAREFERKDSRRSTVEALDFLKGKGMTITEISDTESRRMREKIQNSLKKSAYAEQIKWITEALER
ncbi:MAG: TRAP transporter substrate-binding protein, partial [Acidovorax sp.]